MPLELFKKVNIEAKELTDDITYHILGDPLSISNLKEYLDISYTSNLKVHITTAGNLLNQKIFELLCHEAIKQINFSINSFNANSFNIPLHNYLTVIFEFCEYILKNDKNIFINLRIWNLDDEFSSFEFNNHVFKNVSEFFNLDIDSELIYKTKPKNLRVAKKIFLHFDNYFSWPSLNNKFVSKNGTCHGLKSHCGILSNGIVVPCCLDKDGIIKLGDIKFDSLKNILNNQKSKTILNGFKNNTLTEELCQKCSYRERFN
ncbi:MAG: SPASM domain-containing protein [Campylobacterales bacterium]|nr:SPASM domain-containing protein [Campylobacterales bacterium]